MADRETIMTWLKKCGNGGCSSRCPYDYLGPDKCYETLMTDALELLKEQSEIVRCKDCEHRHKCFSEVSFVNESLSSYTFEKVDFCSLGRKAKPDD